MNMRVSPASLPQPTVRGFLEFARTKPPEERYRYVDNFNCPVAQYLTSLGMTNVAVGGFGEWRSDETGQSPVIPRQMEHVARAAVLCGERTWGSLIRDLAKYDR